MKILLPAPLARWITRLAAERLAREAARKAAAEAERSEQLTQLCHRMEQVKASLLAGGCTAIGYECTAKDLSTASGYFIGRDGRIYRSTVTPAGGHSIVSV